ncbi:MAG: amidohydrolase family protein [Chloroflexota bacterium]
MTTQTIVDAHAHVDEVPEFGWIDPPEKLIPLIDDAGIQKAIIMSYTEAPAVNPNSLTYIADAVARYPDRFVGFARIHPGYGDKAIALLDRAITQMGMKGLKLHPVGTLAHPGNEGSVRLIRRAARYGAPTLFHCGDEPLTTPLEIAEAARKVPEASIILGHMGGYFHVDEAISVAEQYDNIFLETSAVPYPQKIAEAVQRVGAARVIFGSDGPGCNPALEVEKVRMAGLSPADEELVFGGNILGLLERVQS